MSASAIRGGLAEIGVRGCGHPVRVRVISWDKYVNQFTTGRFPRMFLMAADYPSADNFLYDMYNSEQSPYTSGTSYSDPDVDRLLTMARSTTDPAGTTTSTAAPRRRS